jgi:hypothetical protein
MSFRHVWLGRFSTKKIVDYRYAGHQNDDMSYGIKKALNASTSKAFEVLLNDVKT